MKNAKIFLRYLTNQSTRFVGWTRRDQLVRVAANGLIKVNFGCGLQVAPGWINVDGSLNAFVANCPSFVKPIAYRLSGANQFYSQNYYCDTLNKNWFVHHNLLYGLPFGDCTVDFLYSSHFLEHLSRSAGRALLMECLRVLKPGGVLRIAVPDLERAWHMYATGEKERMIHDFFFAEDETGFGQHRYAYDYDLLANALSEIGFNQIQRAKFQEGETPDLPMLDNREDYSLFVEGHRPSTVPGKLNT